MLSEQARELLWDVVVFGIAGVGLCIWFPQGMGLIAGSVAVCVLISTAVRKL